MSLMESLKRLIKYRFLEVLYWLSEINLIETNVFFSSVFNIMVFQSESLVLRIKTVKNDIFHLIQVWTVRYQSVHSVDTVNRLTHIYAQMCPCQIPKIWKPLTWTRANRRRGHRILTVKKLCCWWKLYTLFSLFSGFDLDEF